MLQCLPRIHHAEAVWTQIGCVTAVARSASSTPWTRRVCASTAPPNWPIRAAVSSRRLCVLRTATALSSAQITRLINDDLFEVMQSALMIMRHKPCILFTKPSPKQSKMMKVLFTLLLVCLLQVSPIAGYPDGFKRALQRDLLFDCVQDNCGHDKDECTALQTCVKDTERMRCECETSKP